MKVTYFGSYHPQFSRNHILITGLRQNHVQVVQSHSSAPSLFLRYPQLIYQFLSKGSNCQAIIVGVMGHYDMPLAWVLGKLFHLPVLFDVFYSLYDTYVFDRKIAPSTSIKAKWWWLIDKVSCLLADRVILDTPQHINYFIRTFKVPRHKFIHIPAGADDTYFKPQATKPKPQAKVAVEFHGMFTRLSGAEHFIQAAKQLEANPHLEFWLIGQSNHYHFPLKLLKKLHPKNLHYWSRLPARKLAALVKKAQITVGHLGTTNKAKRIISFKLYQGLASGNVVIAPDTPAVASVLTTKHVAFVPSGKPTKLAQKIKSLAQNPTLCRQLATSGYTLYKNNYTNQRLAKKLLAAIPFHE